MANAVEICNMAMSLLGDSASIASIDPPDSSAASKMCAVYYPITKAAMLEMHDWSFAMRRAELPMLADDETSKWQGVYQLPSDALRVVTVRPANAERRLVRDGLPYPRYGENPPEAVFEVLGRKLYTNAEDPVATYITSEVADSSFTPTFVVAFSYYLALQIAGARIKGKEGQTLAQNLQKQFSVALSTAKSRDANQQMKRIDFIPEWLRVR